VTSDSGALGGGGGGGVGALRRLVKAGTCTGSDGGRSRPVAAKKFGGKAKGGRGWPASPCVENRGGAGACWWPKKWGTKEGLGSYTRGGVGEGLEAASSMSGGQQRGRVTVAQAAAVMRHWRTAAVKGLTGWPAHLQ
jgi:hypothetical protein